MKPHRPLARSLEQPGGNLLCLAEPIERNPARLIRVPIRRDLIPIACPPVEARRRTGPLVGANGLGRMALQDVMVPHLVGGDVVEFDLDREALRMLLRPRAERLPQPLGVVPPPSLDSERHPPPVAAVSATHRPPLCLPPLVAANRC